MHLGEYTWIIAFGDEILRCKISHHISLAPLDSFSSRRSLAPYHAFGLFDKSEFARIMKVPAGGTTQGRSLQRGASVTKEFVRSQQTDKSEFVQVTMVHTAERHKTVPYEYAWWCVYNDAICTGDDGANRTINGNLVLLCFEGIGIKRNGATL